MYLLRCVKLCQLSVKRLKYKQMSIRLSVIATTHQNGEVACSFGNSPRMITSPAALNIIKAGVPVLRSPLQRLVMPITPIKLSLKFFFEYLALIVCEILIS